MREILFQIVAYSFEVGVFVMAAAALVMRAKNGNPYDIDR